MRIWFSKYQALGNDFIILDLRVPQGGKNFSPYEFARRVCDRRFGVGADGLATIEPPSSDEFHYKMRIINSDGSEAEMSGNGIRCIAKYLYDKKIVQSDLIVFETLAGRKEVKRVSENKFEVDMGTPIIEERLQDNRFKVNVGNPHITVLGNFDYENFLKEAQQISKSYNANVEFVWKIEGNNIYAWVWERGVGETLACGTGAVAIFAVAKEEKLVDSEAKIIYKGGELKVKQKNGSVAIEGGAEYIFSGFIEL